MGAHGLLDCAKLLRLGATLWSNRRAEGAIKASTLGVSKRTLARRMSTDGLTFSDILDALRRNLARRYFADGDPTISQVAWLLGFRESAFRHAFER